MLLRVSADQLNLSQLTRNLSTITERDSQAKSLLTYGGILFILIEHNFYWVGA